MRQDVGVDVVVRLVDRLAAPLRDLDSRVGAAGRRMTDRLKLTPTLNTQSFEAAAARLSAAGRRAQQFSRDQMQLSKDHLATSRQRTMGLYGEAAAVAAQGWAFGQLLRPAIAFEAKMAEVGKVIDFQGKNGMRDLGNDIQELVTSGALPMAADGIADIVAAAGSANLVDASLPDAEKRKQLVEFAAAAGKMGIAFDISAEAAGQAMATWRSQLGLTQAETIKLGDAVNFLSNNMNASAADVTDIIARQGGFAKVAGLTTTEIAALATAFRTSAPSPEIAATAMKNFTSTLVAGQAATKSQSTMLKKLGFDSTDLAKRMGVDARGAIMDVMEALQKLPEHERAASLTMLFGSESSGAISPLLENLDNLRRAFDLVGDEAKFAGAMQAEYEGVAGTTAAKLVVFRNYMTRISVALTPLLGAIVQVTEALQPMLTRMSDWMQANPDTVKWIGLTVAGLFAAKVGILATAMALQSVISAYWVFNGALAIGIRGYSLAVRGLAGLLRVFVALRSALPLVARGIALIGRALLANPIGIAVAGIAVAAYAIYQNWEPIKAWFSRLWNNIRDIFGGFGHFVTGVFSGDMSGAVAGLQQVWDGLSGYYRTLWDGITGIFLWAWQSIEPVLDGLFSAVGLGPIWDGVKTAISAALDWISLAFTDAWAAIKPVIDGLRWVQDHGSAAINSVTGGHKGPISSGPYTGGATAPILPPAAVPGVTVPAVPARAQGGTFFPGPLLVGERGPEMRYESRGGFIAHNNALRGLIALSQRARSLAGMAMAEGGGDFGAASMPIPVSAPAGRARQISHEPHYNIVINGSGLDAAQLRAAVRAELQAASRRAAADLRGLLHD